MANDREVLRVVWEGQIPVSIQADSEDIIGLIQPEKYNILVSRLSYLPLVSDKVRKYFMKYLSSEQQESDIWFEYNGEPLKWHIPIGVLYDLCHRDTTELPWNLIIHFSKFPDEELIRFPKKDFLETYFLSCLKEADVLKHRGQVVSAMQKKDHAQLWLGLVNDKFDQFWAVNQRLMETTGDQKFFKHIPIRIYNKDGLYIQRLVPATDSSGQNIQIHDLYKNLSDSYGPVNSIRTHGIELHPNTPLQWLSEHMSYPDNFLHLIVSYGHM